MVRTASNPVIHLELHTAELSRACALYAELCGWSPHRIQVGSASYLGLELGPGVSGGIVEGETPRPLWLPYVAVREVAETTERARELGASVLVEPREGAAGWRSVVASPAGAEVAFWQPKA